MAEPPDGGGSVGPIKTDRKNPTGEGIPYVKYSPIKNDVKEKNVKGWAILIYAQDFSPRSN